MNTSVRRVAVAALGLFALLFLNVNYLQVVKADSLRNNPNNGRLLAERYSRERGDILVGGEAIASSTTTKDALRYLRRYSDGNPAGATTFAPVTGYYPLVGVPVGIERSQDDILSGEDSRLFLRRFSDLVTGRTPQGGDVRLTIDRPLQETAARALGSRRGAVVALDPKTGAVLAMVSSPSYDPNTLTSHRPVEAQRAYDALERDPGRPLLNRATQERYPPGSVFKVVTSALALENGLTPQTVVPSPKSFRLPLSNRSLRNFGGKSCGPDRIPLIRALQVSCNTTFAGLGVQLGGDALRAQARKFGFGTTPDLGVAAVESVFPAELDQPQQALVGIGQFEIGVTPLQMAMVAGGVANRGVVMKPYLVAQVQAPDLSVLSTTEPRQLSRAVSEPTAAGLTEMMVAVVTGGSGRPAGVPGVQVAGKTGTAQNPGRAPHAWFIGFAPAADPKIAFAVIVESGGDLGSEGTGGKLAAPIAAELVRTAVGGRR